MVVAVGKVSVSVTEQDFISQLAGNQEAVDAFLKSVAVDVRENAKRSSDFIDKTGNLRRSIGMRKSKYVNGGYIVKASGRNRLEGATGAKGFHAWLVEFGHEKVLWGKRTGGRVPPRPFMRNAVKKAESVAASKINAMRG